jgi:NAD(P)-dependent dehydrogenase (short-subunit alcohol dehydrogenase family)
MEINEKKLAGRIALVTGASKGIGRAVARVLAAEGAEVAVTARDRGGLESLVRVLEAQGAGALGAAADATREQDVERVRQAVLQRFGRVDILVNNVGSARYAPFPELSCRTTTG